MDAEIVGLKIKELRKKAGLTQSKLGEKIGVSYKAVSKWENGKGLPDVTLFPSLAKVFGVRIDELLSDVEVSEKDNDLEISERMENFQTEETFTESGSDAEVTLDYGYYADAKSEKADATVETMPNRKNWAFRIAAISACVLCFSGIFYFRERKKGGKFVFEAENARTHSSALVIEPISSASNGACVSNMIGSSLLFYIDSDAEEENVALKIYICLHV